MITVNMPIDEYNNMLDKIDALEKQVELNKSGTPYMAIYNTYHGGHGGGTHVGFTLFKETEALKNLREELSFTQKLLDESHKNYSALLNKKKGFWS